MATGATGTTDKGVCTRVLPAGPMSANLSPPAGGHRIRFQRPGQKPTPPAHTPDLPRGGRQAEQGPSAQPRGCENLSSWRRDRAERARGQEQGQRGPGNPGQARQGASHVWNGHGATTWGSVRLAGRQKRREAAAPVAGGGLCSPQLRARPQVSPQAQLAQPRASRRPSPQPTPRGLPEGPAPGGLCSGMRSCTRAPDPQLAAPGARSPQTVLSAADAARHPVGGQPPPLRTSPSNAS